MLFHRRALLVAQAGCSNTGCLALMGRVSVGSRNARPRGWVLSLFSVVDPIICVIRYPTLDILDHRALWAYTLISLLIVGWKSAIYCGFLLGLAPFNALLGFIPGSAFLMADPVLCYKRRGLLVNFYFC